MRRMTALALLAIGAGAAAQAQTYGVATTPSGSFTNSTGTAIATVAVEHSGVQMRVQPQAGNVHNAVNAGAVEFGLDNYYNVLFAAQGIEDYAGQAPTDNIQIAARVLPLQLVVMARADSEIRTLADLRGLRIGSGFGAQLAVDRALRMYLATAGLTYDDMQVVPAQNVVAAADDFRAGRTDAFLFAMGAGKVQEVAAGVGGVRVLSSDSSDEAVARARALVPGVDPIVVEPGPASLGVEAPTTIYGADIILMVNDRTPEDVVYGVVQAMHDHAGQMGTLFPPLREFEPARICRAYDGLDYHAGARRYCEENGLWAAE